MLGGKHSRGTPKGIQGSVQFALVMVVLVMVLGGFGIWGIQVEHQLRLNRCVGKAAHRLRDTLVDLESSNQRMRELRVSIAAAMGEFPAAVPPLKIALQGVAKVQDMRLWAWKAHQGQWLLTWGCGNIRDRPLPLPSLKHYRSPPDILGPPPLEWPGLMPKTFFIQVSYKNRHSAAHVQIEPSGKGGFYETITGHQKWKASWTSPQSPARSSFP